MAALTRFSVVAYPLFSRRRQVRSPMPARSATSAWDQSCAKRRARMARPSCCSHSREVFSMRSNMACYTHQVDVTGRIRPVLAADDRALRRRAGRSGVSARRASTRLDSGRVKPPGTRIRAEAGLNRICVHGSPPSRGWRTCPEELWSTWRSSRGRWFESSHGPDLGDEPGKSRGAIPGFLSAILRKTRHVTSNRSPLQCLRWSSGPTG